MNFYPSILKDLLTNIINFATRITTIDKKVIATIMDSRKSLLFSNYEILVKKDDSNFDITMEASMEQTYVGIVSWLVFAKNHEKETRWREYWIVQWQWSQPFGK